MNAKLPTDPPSDEKPSRANTLLERWEADQRETYRLAAMLRAVDAIDHWYVIYSGGIAFDVMQRALGEQALERIGDFCKTVAALVAEGKSLEEIGVSAVCAAEGWVAMHGEALSNFGK